MLINFIGWLLIGCLGCLAVSILIFSMQRQEGLSILQSLIQQDYNYLVNFSNPRSSLCINELLHKINSSPGPDQIPVSQQLNFIQTNLYKMVQNLLPYYTALILGLNLLIIRLYLLFRWCPLFLLLGSVGFIDGITQRNIRRANAGRESALIYHQAKALILFSLTLGIFADLVLPIGIKQSEWVIIISAILFGFTIQIATKSFKKYL